MNKKVFIIAEAGVNHNGDINLAKKLIDIAVEAKVDAVKFQTWKTELIVSEDADMAEYQKENIGVDENQFQMLKKLELSYESFQELKIYCDSKNIEFLSTPDEEVSANFLNGLQNKFKIGSAEVTNMPFLRHIASFGKDVILSTGMSSMEEVEVAFNTLLDSGLEKNQISLLHVTTQYPTPMQDVNLRAMLSLKEKFGVTVGYSDHTLGIEVPVASVALGAKIVEKHFTIDKSMEGPDHKASLSPIELKLMVNSIRNIELALGDGEKKVTDSEAQNIDVVRKKICAKTDISKGTKLSEQNLILKRANGGISAIEWDNIVGTVAEKSYQKGELI
ncbi:MAG: N-acetylneuraminate synthase [Marinifilaceae bacterium]|jgi:N-acetylneuraminate synthase|nr:N-acetylneuraminate synthase [Marinifilaceae bacterium]